MRDRQGGFRQSQSGGFHVERVDRLHQVHNGLSRKSLGGETVADQLREKFPKLATLMNQAEADVLAFMSFPKAHRVQIHSTNPLERLNAEIKRRTDVVGIFPNEPAITRLAGALLLEQNDEWQLQRRYLPLEGLQALTDNQSTRLSAVVS